MGFADLKPKIGEGNTKIEDLVDIHALPDKEEVVARFLDLPFLPVKRHWIKILAGENKKEISIPKYCLGFDPKTEETDEDKCPYCKLDHDNKSGVARLDFFYLANAIIRDIQENEPVKKVRPNSKEASTGFKEMKSKSWTPVRVIKIKPTLAARIQQIAERNVVKKKVNGKVVQKTFDVTHPQYGIDLILVFDSSKKGTAMYSADKADQYGDHGRTPIEEEESGYLVWNIDQKIVEKTGLETTEAAKKELKRMDLADGEVIDIKSIDDEIDDDDDDDDLLPKSRTKKSLSMKRRKPEAEDFDEDEDEDDEKILRKRKRTSTGSKRTSTGSKRTSTGSKRPVKSRSEAEDEEKILRKRKRTSTGSKRPVKSRSEDEDDGTLKRKRTSTGSKRPVTGSAKRPVTGSAKRPEKRISKKKEEFEDDDYDDDIPF